MRPWALSLCLLLSLLAACATPAPSVIYLVRHAEKAPDPGDGDPDLNEIGEARAAALAHALGDVALDAVFVTHLKRTQQTAAPAAKARGVTPKVLPAGDVDALVAQLKATPAGQRILVVGHSNTIPDVLAGLGLPRPEIRSQDYDDLFVVLAVGADRQLERLHFGAVARGGAAH